MCLPARWQNFNWGLISTTDANRANDTAYLCSQRKFKLQCNAIPV